MQEQILKSSVAFVPSNVTDDSFIITFFRAKHQREINIQSVKLLLSSDSTFPRKTSEIAGRHEQNALDESDTRCNGSLQRRPPIKCEHRDLSSKSGSY